MTYVGRDGEPITREEAIAAFESPDTRRVAEDHVAGHAVSTVWLVIDHGFGGVPVPFETMIFCEHTPGCELDNWTARYSREEEAREGHRRAVGIVTQSKPLDESDGSASA